MAHNYVLDLTAGPKSGIARLIPQRYPIRSCKKLTSDRATQSAYYTPDESVQSCKKYCFAYLAATKAHRLGENGGTHETCQPAHRRSLSQLNQALHLFNNKRRDWRGRDQFEGSRMR